MKPENNDQEVTFHKLLTAADVAQVLRIGTTKFYSMMSCGQLPPSVRLGRARRWRSHDIDLWIEWGCPPIERFQSMKKSVKSPLDLRCLEMCQYRSR